MNNNSNEIDLWQFLLNGINFFKRNKKLVLILTLLGLIFGTINIFINPFQFKSFYKNEFTVRSSVASNETLYEIINAMSINLQQKNNTIHGFPEFRNIKGKIDANINKETRLKLIIEAYDPTNIDSILNAIMNFITTKKNIRNKYELSQKHSMQLLTVLHKKIAECDSMAKFAKYIDCIEMIKKRQSIESEMAESSVISFIELYQDSIFMKMDNSRKIFLSITGFGFFGLICGLLLAFLLETIKRKK